MKKGSLVFLVLICLLCIYFMLMISPVFYTGSTIVSDSLMQKAIVARYRVPTDLDPKKTILSIDKWIELGVQRIDINVSQVKNEIIVHMRNNSTDKSNNNEGLANKSIDNRSKKNHNGIKFLKNFKNEQLLTLEDLIKLIDGRAILAIEIKDGSELHPEIEKKIVKLINKYQAYKWTIVQSFNDSVLIKIHKLDSKIIIHKLLIAEFPLLKLIYDLDFRITNFEYYYFVDEFSTFYTFTTSKTVNKVHQMNKKINVWSVNDSSKIKRFVNLGVDGILIDYPIFLN